MKLEKRTWLQDDNENQIYFYGCQSIQFRKAFFKKKTL